DEPVAQLPQPRLVWRVAEVRLALGVPGIVPIAEHRRGERAENRRAILQCGNVAVILARLQAEPHARNLRIWHEFAQAGNQSFDGGRGDCAPRGDDLRAESGELVRLRLTVAVECVESPL